MGLAIFNMWVQSFDKKIRPSMSSLMIDVV